MRRTAGRESRTEINKDISRAVDSLSKVAVRIETASLLSSADLIETSVIVFDTSVPADSGGRPPVKAVIRQTARHETVARDTAAATASADVRVESETTDRSVERTETIPAAARAGSWWRTTKRVLIALGVALALGLIIWGVYRLTKIFRK